MRNTVIVILLALGLFNFFGCSSVTRQSRKQTILGASQEGTVEGTGTSSADVRSMAEKIAYGIKGVQWPAALSTVRIAVLDFDNRSRFGFDTLVIKDNLLNDLIQLSSNEKLQFTESPANADYTLSCRITGLSKGSAAGVNDYLYYSFKLVNKTNDVVIWTDKYETKKQGDVNPIYR